LACILITALIAALVSGLLSWAGGMNPPTAVLAGAGAFSGSTLLMITALRFTSAAE